MPRVSDSQSASPLIPYNAYIYTTAARRGIMTRYFHLINSHLFHVHCSHSIEAWGMVQDQDSARFFVRFAFI